MTIRTQIELLTMIRDDLAAKLNATPTTVDASPIISALGSVNVAIADLYRAEHQDKSQSPAFIPQGVGWTKLEIAEHVNNQLRYGDLAEEGDRPLTVDEISDAAAQAFADMTQATLIDCFGMNEDRATAVEEERLHDWLDQVHKGA